MIGEGDCYNKIFLQSHISYHRLIGNPINPTNPTNPNPESRHQHLHRHRRLLSQANLFVFCQRRENLRRVMTDGQQ